jgi:hypothetical protein
VCDGSRDAQGRTSVCYFMIVGTEHGAAIKQKIPCKSKKHDGAESG